MDAVIEALVAEVDRTLLRENLDLTPEQRVIQLMSLIEAADELRREDSRPGHTID